MVKRIIGSFIIIMFLIIQVMPAAEVKAGTNESEGGQESPIIQVRVEGLKGTIVEDGSSGKSALEIVKAVLDKNNIPCEVSEYSFGDYKSHYISSIDGLAEKKFNGSGGWLYYIKKSDSIVSPYSGMDEYVPKEGESIVLYYADYMTPYVNDISFTPNVVKSNESFKMRFSYKHSVWPSNDLVDTPIIGAIVNIDNLNYITNGNGEIEVKGLSEGEHTYKISGYNINTFPSVVMDKGVFTIDNLHSPSFDHSDSKYGELEDKDNSRIKKNVGKEIESTLNYIRNTTNDPWASVTLNKFSIKSDEKYIKENAEEIIKYGSKDYSNTDLEKLIIHLTASGYSPYNFMGSNLVAELFNRDINRFYINDLIFGLISYKYANIPEKYKITKGQLVEKLLQKQLKYESNGVNIMGWALYGNIINPDITGMVINSLSEFYDSREDAKAAVDGAVQSLSLLQDMGGYLHDEYGRFSESISFSILGLTSVGINPEGVLFTKEKGDLFSALLSFKGTNGQFKHSLDGGNNYIATEQALRALIALREFNNSGKYDFYKSDIKSELLPIYKYQPAKNSDKNDNKKSSGNSSVVVPTQQEEKDGQGGGATSIESFTDYDGQIIKNDSKYLIDILKNVSEEKLIKVDANDNKKISKEVFDLIEGKNRIISFEAGGFTWTFRGNEINKPTKDIDLELNTVSEFKEQIGKRIEDPLILSFKNNGTLPGRAEIKFKPDSKWMEGKDINNIFLYYYDSGSDKIEKTAGPLNVDKEGYLTINIVHCSDYFLYDKDLTLIKEGGSLNYIGWIGTVLMILGAVLTGIMLISNKHKEGRNV